MKDYSNQINKATRILTEQAVTADLAIIESVLDSLTDMVADGDKQAIKAFFKADPKGVSIFLKTGKLPTTLAGRRFVAMYQTLQAVLDVVFEGETMQVESFLASTGIPAAQAEAIAASSLFMSPTIKQAILTEWVDKPYNGYPLSERIWAISKDTENTLMQMIAAGYADGKNPKQLSGLVRGITQQKTASNIRRLLLTENSRISDGVQRLAVKEFKHIKYCKLVYGVRHKKECACTPIQKRGVMEHATAPTLPIHPNSSSYYNLIPTPVDEWKKERGYM